MRGPARPKQGKNTWKRIIFTLISTIGDCCLGHRIRNQDPHALVLALLHISTLNVRERVTHHKILNGKEELPEKKRRTENNNGTHNEEVWKNGSRSSSR